LQLTATDCEVINDTVLGQVAVNLLYLTFGVDATH